MATHRTAQVVGARAVGTDARLLELELDDGAAFGFRGGQYVILDTGVVVGDKAIKRAYSFASADAGQQRVEIIVKRLEGGPGSAAMHHLAIGSRFTFSGPWGKLQPEVLAESTGRVLVLATDTGITAAMGVVTARAFAPRLASTTLVWLRASHDDFVAEAFVAARLPSALRELRVVHGPAAGHPERAEFGAQIARDLAGATPDAIAEAYLVGDGKVLVAARDALVDAGVATERVRLEYFFNTPPKNTTSP